MARKFYYKACHQREAYLQAPRCDFESGGAKFPNGGACPMLLLGGILF